MDTVAALAEHFLMQPMQREELLRLRPQFEVAGFADCRRRAGVLARQEGAEGVEGAQDGEDTLYFICTDPLALATQQWFEPLIERLRPRRLVRALVTEDDLLAYFAQCEPHLRAMDLVQEGSSEPRTDMGNPLLELSLQGIEAIANATVRLADSTLFDALRAGASDIHFEVQDKSLRIKYRLDGVLEAVRRVDSLDTAEQVISRIKVLADLDIAERRIPQDGRFRVLMEGREVDFRVSIMPNLAGEDAVLRVLDRKHLTGQFDALTLDTLRFQEDAKAFVRRAAQLPYGLLLVTGPTGSGKTTTLYAAISEINTGLDKIITIEDPIEYQLSGVLQIPVNEKKGLSFARGLRSVLRHDPDKIMVGEIRDSETAQIAVQAALTGHQVFTTVHANNVFDVIGRFSNMGVDSYSLVAALTGIMAQRLVRLVCPHCARRDESTPPHLKAVGCAHCRRTGYKGRAAIAEMLPMDDQVRDALVQRMPMSALKALAREKGFRGLRTSGLALAQQGLTTIEEIDRVAPVELA